MKIANTNTIQFDAELKFATLNLSPTKQIALDEETLFQHTPTAGFSGYVIINKDGEYSVSARVMKQISKYLTFSTQSQYCDYFKINFQALSWS